MIVYHASGDIVEFPEVRKTKYTKDFSWGFYCTSNYEQAVRWANRRSGHIVNKYCYEENTSLNILKFEEMNDEWLDFIARCRNGETHRYDIVEGPMANDTVWNYVNDFLSGNLSKKQFWTLAEFKHPTHQISFHTLAALDCIEYKAYEVTYDREGEK